MALEKIDIDHLSMVKGAYINQGDTPLFLGEKAKSDFYKGSSGSNIAIGFDTRISPAQVRIYYQSPTPHNKVDPDTRYGLIMTKQLSFDDLPVLPSVFSPALEYQDNYCAFTPNGIFQHKPISPAFAVDMLPPNEYVQLGLANPFFAYNALLHTQKLKMEDIFKLNEDNGYMAKYKSTEDKKQPLCASLFAPIGIDIEAPYLSDITDFIAHQKQQKIEPVGRFKISPQEISQGLLLDKVLSIGGTQIPIEQVLDMRMVGDYMILVIDDPENYPAVLIADPWQGYVYLYDIDLMEDIQQRNIRNLFDRFTTFVQNNWRHNKNFPNLYYFGEYTAKQQVDKMRSGGTHSIACHYRVYAVESWNCPSGELMHTCLEGLEFVVKRTFDKDNLQFNPLEIMQPTFMSKGEVSNFAKQINSQRSETVYLPELEAYYNSLLKTLPASIDATQWFRTQPALPASIISITD